VSDEGAPQRYRHVAAALREQIAARAYPIGSELPTVSALAAEFDVSHMTIKKALATLSVEGLITTRRGARTRVTAMPAGPPKPLHAQVSELRAHVDALDARLSALESHVSKETQQPAP
jgi:DNA-binding GntR family transcriptional regulator